MVGRVDSVDQVVGCHDGVRVRFLYCNLKPFQVDFPQSPLAYVGVGKHPVVLLIVGGKMLKGRSLAAEALHPSRGCRGTFP